tara:strand:+ start:32090 stop:32911 length:822 start_codon:yes stop_codon:yes gene_type:complete
MVSFQSYSSESSIYWEITSPKGKKHYLFGTIHIDDNRVINFHPEVEEGIKASNIFLMETNEIQDFKILLTKISVYEDKLSTKELDKMKSLAYFHTIPFERVMMMKPWLLAVIFNSPRPITPFNQDNLLKTEATDSLLVTQGLESVQEHFSVLDTFPLNDQMDMLKKVLSRKETDKEKDYEALVEAYQTNNPEKILEVDERITKNIVSDKMWNEMKKKLLINRNTLFFKRILDLEEGNKLFIAVGASHLGGKNGLLNLFIDAGYSLQPLSPLVK